MLKYNCILLSIDYYILYIIILVEYYTNKDIFIINILGIKQYGIEYI